jgi:hypothetical protein
MTDMCILDHPVEEEVEKGKGGGEEEEARKS